MTKHLSLRLDLLDQQIVCADAVPIGTVDDVEIHVPAEGAAPPTVDALLTGAQAYGERLGGMVGSVVARTAASMRPREHPPGPVRIDIRSVRVEQEFVQTLASLHDMPQVATLEQWLQRHVIGPLPRSQGHAGE